MEIYKRPPEREAELLARVPVEWQKLVEKHVSLWRERDRHDTR